MNHGTKSPLDSAIASFIHAHHVFFLATCDNNTPYACSCFYVFDEKGPDLVFASERRTRHAQEMTRNARVAGVIHVETRAVRQIQGVQFLGIVFPIETEFATLTERYASAFPEIREMEAPMWRIRLDYVKMTDNPSGFGTKRIWQP